jgi:DNA-binding transcriptional MocR family regulator
MKPGPRALYVELKRRFNGSNNGAIYLSHRAAASALNVSRNTVGPYFQELELRGFIRLTVGPYLGPSGIGQASVWALEELPAQDGKTAGKAFMRWLENKSPAQNLSHPVTKNRTPTAVWRQKLGNTSKNL